MQSASFWKEKFKLKQHPEGGYFCEIYRSPEQLPAAALPKRYLSARCLATSIYFLLENTECSKFHRLKTDEIWHFYIGASMTIHVIAPTGEYCAYQLGSNFEAAEQFQVVIPAGHWFGATVNQANSYVLVGCSVAPGFEFEDFELGNREELLSLYPQHQELIETLTE